MRPSFAAILLLVSVSPATAQNPGHRLTPARAKAVDEAVRKVMADQGLVGAAIGLIRDGEVAYTQGYGWEDREKRQAMTPETVVNWASNCKPTAAVLAMQLVEKGKLDLDADVRKYVPEFPDKGATITVRQLLYHQSGIPHYSNGQIVPAPVVGRMTDGPPDPVRSLDRFLNSPLLFKPGTRAEYSSYAYILLSAAIERAGKQPYDAQARDRIARPLGLRTFQLDERTPGAHWAAGYEKKDGRVVRAPEAANDWKFGAGGYKSDVRDFAAWGAALVDRRLVSPESERLMWTPQLTADGKATHFGLGFVVERQGGRLKVSHNGKQGETTTRLVLYPESRSGVVVLTNCSFGEPGVVSTAVFKAISGGE